MKKIAILSVCFLTVICRVQGRSEMSPEMTAYKNVELMIGISFPSGSDLPATWEAIPGIREMMSNPTAVNLARLKQINHIALVPAAPLIRPELGISNERANKKLFAIGRDWASKGLQSDPKSSDRVLGKYIILVDPETNMPLAQWISEAEARIILQQIEGFDPKAQPVAFENVAQLERERNYRHQRLADDVKKHTSFARRWNLKGYFAGGRGAWFGGGLAVLVLFAWLALRKWRR